MKLFSRKKETGYVRFPDKNSMLKYEKYREWYLTKDIYDFHNIFGRIIEYLSDPSKRELIREFKNYKGGYWLEGNIICATDTIFIDPSILKEGDLICTDNGYISRCFKYSNKTFVQILPGNIDDIRAVMNNGK